MYNLTNGVFTDDNGYGVLLTGAPNGYQSTSIYIGADTNYAPGIRFMYNNSSNHMTTDLRGSDTSTLSFRHTTNGSSFSNMLTLANDTSVSNALRYGATVGGRMNASSYVVSSTDTRAPTSTGLYLSLDGSTVGSFSVNKGSGSGGFSFSTYNSDGSLSKNNLNLLSNGLVQAPLYNVTTSLSDTDPVAIMGFDSNGNMVRNYTANQRFRVAESRLTAIENDLTINIPVKLNEIVTRITDLNFFSQNIAYITPFIPAIPSTNTSAITVSVTVPVATVSMQIYSSLPLEQAQDPNGAFQQGLIATIAANLGIPTSNVRITSVTSTILQGTIGKFRTSGQTVLVPVFEIISKIDQSGTVSVDATTLAANLVTAITTPGSSFTASLVATLTVVNENAGVPPPVVNTDASTIVTQVVSAPVSVAVPVAAVVSSVPTNVIATIGSVARTATVSFIGDSTAYLFTVQSTPSSGTSFGARSPILVSGLTAGTSYTFTVSATNASGTSSYSVASNAVVPLAPVVPTPMPTPIVPTPTPVLSNPTPNVYYSFNNSAIDTKNNATNQSVVGTVTYVSGFSNTSQDKAINLQAAEIRGSYNFGNSWTFATWVYTKSNHNAVLLQGTGIMLYIQFQVSGTFHIFNNSDGTYYYTGGATSYMNTWTHIALTYSQNGSFVLYINGTSIFNITAPSFPTITSYVLGQQYPGYEWNGYLQNTSIYNVQLNSSQVNVLLVPTPTVMPTPGPVVSSFTPPQFGGLQLWLDASTLGLSNGAAVSSWSTSGGTSYTATSSTMTYATNMQNGLGVIRFANGVNGMTIPNFKIAQTQTIFIITSAITGGGIFMEHGTNTNNGNNSPGFYVYANGAQNYNMNRTGNSQLYVNYGSVATNNFLLMEAFNDPLTPNSMAFYLNGTSLVSGIPDPGSNVITANLNFNSRVQYGCYLAEVIIYNTALTSSQRQLVEGYLATKWGIKSLLDPSHPYYSSSVSQATTPTVTTQTLSFTGANQTFTVPEGVNSITASVYGAAGGSSSGCIGGAGAFVQGSFNVTPGQTLTVIVGGGGTINGSTGGFGGGGGTRQSASAGGGRSAIIMNGTEILTAGGGGGSGASTTSVTITGCATYTGVSGSSTATTAYIAQGQGNQVGYGAFPYAGGLCGRISGGYTIGTDGTFNQGGLGANWCGGGGGGYYGGGGGGGTFGSSGYGGGSGSSYYSPTVVQFFTGANSSDNATGIFGTNNIGQATTNTNGGNGIVVLTLSSQSLPTTSTFMFTPMGALGRNGPTSITYSLFNSAFTSASITLSSGIQRWTVQQTGYYQLTAAGGSGGANQQNRTGGAGMIVQNTVLLNQGDILYILVGQIGQKGNVSAGTGSGGGGGGTYIAKYLGGSITSASSYTLLLVAGGGGGGGVYGDGIDAVYTTSGTSSNYVPGGTNGNGGGGNRTLAPIENYPGGGGYFTNGNSVGVNAAAGSGGYGFLNGGQGGLGENSLSIGIGCEGGFGGGAGGGCNQNWGAGGGGGYSGGASPGYGHENFEGLSMRGGSGGSYDINGISGVATSIGLNYGDGYVIIKSTPQPVTSLVSFTFTPMGAKGASGPTSITYGASAFNYICTFSSIALVSGIQRWTIQATGLYTITAAGASGGRGRHSYGGRGIVVSSTISLTKNDVIYILVGQVGTDDTGCAVGTGGGATYVVKYNGGATTSASSYTILLIAGAGGAGGFFNTTANPNGRDAVPTTTGGNDFYNTNAVSSGGNGGNATGTGGAIGGAGGGFLTNGSQGPQPYNGGYAGLSFLNGGTGGSSGFCGAVVSGGFGGGGGSGSDNWGVGGGGGYSGGSTGGIYQGWVYNTSGGGGGGSYDINGPSNNATPIDYNRGDGYVAITKQLTTPTETFTNVGTNWVTIAQNFWNGCALSYDGSLGIVGLGITASIYGTGAYTNTVKPWQSATVRNSGNSTIGVGVSSSGQYTILSGTEGLYVSNTSGTSYTTISTTAYNNCAVSGNGIYMIANKFGGSTFMSTNYGVTWNALSLATTNYCGCAISFTGAYMMLGTRSSGTYLSSNYGQTWTTVSYSGNGCAISYSGQYQTLVVYNGPIYVSSDYGATWTSTSVTAYWTACSMSNDGRYQVACSSTNAGVNGRVYVSTNYGVTWTLSSQLGTDLYSGVAISGDGSFMLLSVLNLSNVSISNFYYCYNT
jgi:hypothetical protein